MEQNYMNQRVLKTTDQSIKGQLSGIKPEKALAEYIWNGFDANADKVELNTEINSLGTLISITIKDNGDGIEYDDLENTLDLFLDSKKKNISKPTTRGRKGRGRFTFVRFCDKAEWISYFGNDGFHFTIDSGCLNTYKPEKIKTDCSTKKGTQIKFTHIKEIDFDYFNNCVVPFLKK